MSLVWGVKWMKKLKMGTLKYILTGYVNDSRQNPFRLFFGFEGTKDQ
jgi:hypothetical protein